MKEYEVRTFLKSYIGKVVPNYIVPGLTSSLVGGVTPRMFSMTRPQELFVAPHNHRYDFACYVLRGRVVNVMYEPTADLRAPEYAVTRYDRERGQLAEEVTRARFLAVLTEYGEGSWYGMGRSEFHSIGFDQGTEVLFLEGPSLKEETYVLEPVVDGKVLRTFQKPSWMQEGL